MSLPMPSSVSPPGTLLMRGSQNGALLILCLIYFTSATNSVGMFVKSNEKADTPRVVLILETKLEYIADYEVGK
jgi:hypothetical protein